MQQSTLDDHQDSVDYTDPEALERLYHDLGLSVADIAEQAGVAWSTVSRHMDKHEIERRSFAEALRDAHRVEYATLSMNGNGYYQWESTWNGDRVHVRVCRLLAVAEYGFEAVCDMVVHHKNEIPWLDYADNIELKTRSEHASHHATGENSGQSKLSEEEAREVKRLANEGDLLQREVGEMFGVGQDHVSRIKSGEMWPHLD